MPTESNKPYKNALIFSGGSSLSGYYLGMYEALCELEKHPDVILASCGGTFMAGLISLFPDPKLAKQLLLSTEFYQMLCRVQSKPPKTRTIQLSSVIQRYFDNVQGNLKTNLQANIQHNLDINVIGDVLTPLANHLPDYLSKKLSNSFTKLENFYKQQMTTTYTLVYQPLRPTNKKSPLPLSLMRELAEKALFEIEKESSDNTLWQFKPLADMLNTLAVSSYLKKPDIIVVVSRTNTQESSTNDTQQPHQQKELGFLWQQVLCCNNHKTAAKIENLVTKASVGKYSKHIMEALHVTSNIPLALAVRASINDMFYLPPIQFKPNDAISKHNASDLEESKTVNNSNKNDSNKINESAHIKNNVEMENCHLFGGIIDLLPIEVASKIADNLYVECKSPLDSLIAEPAIKSVFGFSANKRRKDTRAFTHEETTMHWIDTTDNAEKIDPMFERKYDLLAGCVAVKHHSYEEYVTIAQAQYQYGYDKVMKTKFDDKP